jgi:hypothetical protein
MCLLIIKPSNVKYDHDFIIWSVNNGITYNRDGIGGAVRKQLTNTLLMNKGFFNNNVEHFYEWLKACDIQPGDELMIHLRQGTAGQKSTFNQHPYILGELPTEGIRGAELTLDSDNVETGVFAHNGIFYNNSYFDVSKDLSDSYNWAYSYFGTEDEIKELKLKGEDAFTASVNQDLIGQKVCFMFPDRELIRVGNYHSEKGFLFSNKGYTNGSYNDRGGVQVKTNSSFSDDDFEDDEHNPYNYWWVNALNNTRNLPAPSSNLDLPKTNSEETKVISIDNKVDIEIKKKVNTSFDFSIEILETPKSDTKIINIGKNNKLSYFRKKPNIYINIDSDDNINSNLDVYININNKNKDHFLLRAKKDLVKITHTIKSDSIHYINNCYASSENPNYTHALSIKSIDFENDYTSVVTTRSLNDDFQVMPKKVFAHIYKDYMKLVDLYGETISNNKRKKLRTLYDTINRINSSNINTVNNFYKTKFNSKALVMFYENFYKEEVPKIKSRLENIIT